MHRRRFLNKISKSLAIFPALSLMNCQTRDYLIDEIKVYRYDINTVRHFSWGTWYNRQHAFVKFQAGNHSGWAEIIASKNNPELDIGEWGSFLKPFKGMKINEAYDLIKSQQNNQGKNTLDVGQLELIEMALLDLLGRIENTPSVHLLDMKAENPVPGLFTILQKDMEVIESQIQDAIDLNLDSHVKFKMFGDLQLDLQIAKLARKKLGADAMILADANRGYKDFSGVRALAKDMHELHQAGLDAMEDPAEITVEEWIQLQDMVNPLKLIPDHPLRPAWHGLNIIKSGMGQVYNFHPDSMGSLHHLQLLSEKVKQYNADIMVGDDSLVGPACNVWQQIAIGVGAVWVEAIEKAEDSDNYLRCVKSKPTYRNESGLFAANFKPGFGLEMDEQKLDKLCEFTVEY